MLPSVLPRGTCTNLVSSSLTPEAELLQQQSAQMDELRRRHEEALRAIDREAMGGAEDDEDVDDEEQQELVTALKEVGYIRPRSPCVSQPTQATYSNAHGPDDVEAEDILGNWASGLE